MDPINIDSAFSHYKLSECILIRVTNSEGKATHAIYFDSQYDSTKGHYFVDIYASIIKIVTQN